MKIKINEKDLIIKENKIKVQLFASCYPDCNPDCTPECSPNCNPNCNPNCDPNCVPTCSPSCNPCFPSTHCNPEIFYCNPEN